METPSSDRVAPARTNGSALWSVRSETLPLVGRCTALVAVTFGIVTSAPVGGRALSLQLSGSSHDRPSPPPSQMLVASIVRGSSCSNRTERLRMAATRDSRCRRRYGGTRERARRFMEWTPPRSFRLGLMRIRTVTSRFRPACEVMRGERRSRTGTATKSRKKTEISPGRLSAFCHRVLVPSPETRKGTIMKCASDNRGTLRDCRLQPALCLPPTSVGGPR